TSLLHLVRQRLDADGTWSVVALNPWMLSDLPSMIHEFFIALLSAMPKSAKGKVAREKAAQFARVVSPITSPLRLVGLDPSGALSSLAELLDGDQSLEARHADLH